jgi:hypothetical protein
MKTTVGKQGGEKMTLKGIKKLVEELKNIEGSNVKINIGHKLYGDQNLQVALQIIDDEERLGFLLNEQEIYIDKNSICNVGAKDGLWYFADKVMCIKIRKCNEQ